MRLRVPDMDCASCLLKIQNHLADVEGVRRVEGNPVTRQLTLTLAPGEVEIGRVREALARLGYQAEALDGRRPLAGERPSVWTGRQARWAGASALLFAVALLLRVAGVVEPRVVVGPWQAGLPELLLVASALVGGANFFPKGWRAARALALDMNVLMSVAIVGAVLIGEFVEAASIAFLFALAELLEGHSVERARTSVEALLELAPDTARLEEPGGAESVVAADALAPGDVVLIRPGDRVPADARVVEGWAALDQSAITGESLPVDKGPGHELFAGTVNRDGFLRARVLRPADDSALSRIVRLVEEAEMGRSRTERFVERFARIYTPLVVGAAILMVVLPVAVMGLPFATWFERGLTLLVIACPCALVISTPVAVVSGLTAAARHGVLVKGGRHLEAMGEVRVLALDKTGTLTLGQLEVVEVRPAPGEDPDRVLALAAAAERGSEHPVGRAIVRAAGRLSHALGQRTISDFRSHPGVGVEAVVDARRVQVGRSQDRDAQADAAGRTVVAVTVEGAPAGTIALADRVRPDAVQAVAALRQAGLHTAMLTGDAPAVASQVARELGVDEVRAGLMPGEKVDAVKALEAARGRTAMVGDGVNDAPALAAATVGIAMGAAGSDTALETADVALMGDDLRGLPYLVHLARKSRRVIRQNVAAAIGIKALLAVGVPLGWVSLITAVVVGDMGVSLAVTFNALRLARIRP